MRTPRCRCQASVRSSRDFAASSTGAGSSLLPLQLLCWRLAGCPPRSVDTAPVAPTRCLNCAAQPLGARPALPYVSPPCLYVLPNSAIADDCLLRRCACPCPWRLCLVLGMHLPTSHGSGGAAVAGSTCEPALHWIVTATAEENATSGVPVFGMKSQNATRNTALECSEAGSCVLALTICSTRALMHCPGLRPPRGGWQWRWTPQAACHRHRTAALLSAACRAVGSSAWPRAGRCWRMGADGEARGCR